MMPLTLDTCEYSRVPFCFGARRFICLGLGLELHDRPWPLLAPVAVYFIFCFFAFLIFVFFLAAIHINRARFLRALNYALLRLRPCTYDAKSRLSWAYRSNTPLHPLSSCATAHFTLDSLLSHTLRSCLVCVALSCSFLFSLWTSLCNGNALLLFRLRCFASHGALVVVVAILCSDRGGNPFLHIYTITTAILLICCLPWA